MLSTTSPCRTPCSFGKAVASNVVLAVPEAQRAVLPLLDADPLPARSPRGVGRVEDVQHALVVQGQALRDEAGLLPAEDAGQVVGRLQGAVGVVLASRSAREPAVVVRDELRGEGVRGLDVADPAQPELLDQPVLQRQVSALDAALRRRRVGAQDVDVQAAEGSAELRDSSPALGLLLVDSEHRGLVAVQRHRLAVLLEVGAHRREVGERRLRLAEQQLHQGAGCVVDEHQQGAATGALLEPLVVAAVDLDELAATRPTAPGLLDPRLSASPGDPQAVLDHPVPERLDRELQAVQLRQLLVGERRAEALVPGADGGERLPAQLRSQPPIAGSAAMLRRQAPGAVPLVGSAGVDAPAGSSSPASWPPHAASAASRSPARSRSRDPAPRSSCSLSPCPRGYRGRLEKADISTLEKPDISIWVLHGELSLRALSDLENPLVRPSRSRLDRAFVIHLASSVRGLRCAPARPAPHAGERRR